MDLGDCGRRCAISLSLSLLLFFLCLCLFFSLSISLIRFVIFSYFWISIILSFISHHTPKSDYLIFHFLVHSISRQLFSSQQSLSPFFLARADAGIPAVTSQPLALAKVTRFSLPTSCRNYQLVCESWTTSC